MAACESAQTRALRRQLLFRLVAYLAGYVVVFAAVFVLLDAFFLDDWGNAFADATSPWVYYSEEEFYELIEIENTSNYQFIHQSDGTMAGRDLSLYLTVKSMKYPAAVTLCLLGYVVIVLIVLNRTIRCFDDLASAVGSLLSNREVPVNLPELPIAQDELNAIRESALADERAAKAAERRKNELVAYLAHDVKTPLTSVIGYLSLLSESRDLSEVTRARYTDVALEKAERLEGLIEEFFEITRYNLQAIPIERASVDVQLFCEQVAENFYPDAQARNLTIKVEAPADQTFFVDPGKLARAVGNVVRNAVAYADEGSCVELRARRSEVTGAWLLTVSNEGREISEAHLQSIFDKFYREDAARATNSGGAGLGLAIAKEIVIAHGGGIRAESANGTTVFTIALL